MGRNSAVPPPIACVLIAAIPVQADVLGYGGEPTGTGWYPDQPLLTPGLVSGGSFGRMWTADVSGQVYAQPVIDSGTVLAVTEQNQAYGLDEATGTVTWQRSLGTPWDPAPLSCADLTPTIGVTGTPVIDPATHTAYFFAKTYLSGGAGPAAWYAHAVDTATGNERPGFPVLVQGQATNSPSLSFNATTELQRPGLLLLDGVVYAAFGGHCDRPPFAGWVVGISPAGQLTTLWAAGSGDNPESGIWQSGAALTTDGPGQILLVTGNGDVADVPTPGSNPPADLGQAVVRLTVQPDGSLQPTDFFAPYDAEALNEWDGDVGSGGLTVLPESFGTPSHPELAVTIGKEGYFFVLDRSHLGGYRQGPGQSDDVVNRIGPIGGAWSKPSVWGGDGGYVYVTTASDGATNYTGGSGRLVALKRGIDGQGLPTFAIDGTTEDRFGFGSGSPTISSNGADASSALVWVIWSPDGTGNGAQLRAYDPVPLDGVMQLRWSGPIGRASKFTVPAIDGNRLFVGTRDGHVISFGSPVSTPLTGGSVTLPTTVVGQTSLGTATFTATTSLTVTAINSSDAAFAVGATLPPLPAVLQAGATLSVPISYSPTSAGPDAATIELDTTAGPYQSSANGNGQLATGSLAANPTAVSFGGTTPGGPPLTTSLTLRNDGATALSITDIAVPGPPFTVDGLPTIGSTLSPGESRIATLSFAPTDIGLFTDTLTITSTGGDISVPMSGTAATPPDMVITPQAVDYGTLGFGDSSVKEFSIANTGGTTLVLTRSKPPFGGAFTPLTSVPEGSTIPPGQSINVTVRFAPSEIGPISGSWSLNGNDGGGARDVTFNGSGVAPAAAAPPFGSLDGAAGEPGPVSAGAIAVTGWAIDPDTTAPIDVHTYIDGVFAGVTPANTARPDVGAAYPGYGNQHGYQTTYTGLTAGTHTVCTYGINVGVGGNALIGCTEAVVPGGSPFGSLDNAAASPGSVRLSGWVIDPDTFTSIEVHTYVDGIFAGATTANTIRFDVGVTFWGYGNQHGYDATYTGLTAGPHTVCTYGINLGVGGNALIGCRNVVTPEVNPFGSLDGVDPAPVAGSVGIAGWAIDPDTPAPIDVHTYIDGVFAGVTPANTARPDVGAAYPGYGNQHGYQTTYTGLTAGTHTVCTYGINVGVGGNALIGCRTVLVS